MRIWVQLEYPETQQFHSRPKELGQGEWNTNVARLGWEFFLHEVTKKRFNMDQCGIGLSLKQTGLKLRASTVGEIYSIYRYCHKVITHQALLGLQKCSWQHQKKHFDFLSFLLLMLVILSNTFTISLVGFQLLWLKRVSEFLLYILDLNLFKYLC